MKKFFVFEVFSILFAAVASFNIQTIVTDGAGSPIGELAAPFKKIGDNYYLIEFSINRTWQDAVHFCRTQGAHLTSIESEGEWKALNTNLLANNYSPWFWIGANDIDTPFEFFWIGTGQPMLYTKWAQGEPSNSNKVESERCVLMYMRNKEFQMNDGTCKTKMPYICKANVPKTITITVW